MRNPRSCILLAMAAVTASYSSPATTAAPTLNAKQLEVWQGEVDYWKYVNARDEQRYLALWAPEFQGWPCGAERPTDFEGLVKSTREWFAEVGATKSVTTPTPEAVVLGPGFAITYLSAAAAWTDKEGKPQSSLLKLVHTWKATDKGWKIVGGMCGPLERKGEPAK